MSLEKKSPLHPKRCILLAAGGTGGHLLPAQMAASDLLEKNCRVVFAAKGLSESSLFDRKRFEFYDIASASVCLKTPWQMLRSFFYLSKGVWQSLRLFSSLLPDVVVGFGSYHSFPLLFAAWLKKIPIIIFQPDRSLGRVNRFFAKKAALVALQFPLEKMELGRVAYVPLLPWKLPPSIPQKKEAREMLGIKPDLFTLLVFGGSQGAKFINETIVAAMELLRAQKIAFQIIHLTGENPEWFAGFYEKHSIPFYVRSFEKNMAPLFQSADMAICRAGASTCAELITFDLPYLLIPYPYAQGHQSVNARYMHENVRGGEMVLQESATPDLLFRKICQKKSRLSYHKKKIQEFKKARSRLHPKTLCDMICAIGRVFA